MHLSHQRYSPKPVGTMWATPKAFIEQGDTLAVAIELIVARVFLLITGSLAVAFSSRSQASRGATGAGVVLIGPIPVAFGSDGRWVSLAVALAVVLVVLDVGVRAV